MRALATLALLAFAGCDAAPEGERLGFEIGGAALTITAPESVRTDVGQDSLVIDFRPDARQPQRIELRSGDPTASEYLPESQRIADGATLRYETQVAAGGSGGEEAYLHGAVWLGDLLLSVACVAQSEYPPPEPEWCLPWLETLARE